MRKNYIQGLVCVGITTILFSLMEVVLKFISGDFHPVQITFSRFLVGGLVLLPFSLRALKKLKSQGVTPDKKDFLSCLLLGTIGVTVSMTFYQLAVANASASTVAVLFSSNPLFVYILAFLILHDPIRPRNIIAVILDIAGIICIIAPWNTSVNKSGVIFAVLAAIVFALYSVLSKPKCNKLGGITVTCFSFIFGSIVLIILLLLGHIEPISSCLTAHGLDYLANVQMISGYSIDNILIVIFVYVIVTGIGYASYFTAVEKTNASTASLAFFFKPILAPIFALIILHETISLNMIIGIALILTGSLINICPGVYKKSKKLGTYDIHR